MKGTLHPVAENIISFQIKGACRTKGGIYTAVRGYTDFVSVCPVWICSVGPQSELYGEVKPGDVALILDHFELEPIVGIWEQYRDDERFKLLKDRVEELDGYVCTARIHADSIVAIVDIRDRDYVGGREISFGSGETGTFKLLD